ncbi:HNH endonuclease [Flavicella sediminum]|uniref:HNH endonuclease n=1 Tax=Flavicella sediminum TaxID=2585141 RepID=UPI0011201A7F|nr:HNH endonuclease [Flavicella sediminum]
MSRKSDDKAIIVLIIIAIPIYILYKILEGFIEILQSLTNIIVDNINIIITVIVFSFLIYILSVFYPIIYFKSKKFKKLKNTISHHIKNCNELNQYIEELKKSYLNMSSYNYGMGEMTDSSFYNYERSKWKNQDKSFNVHNCSATVCKNASNQPIKYLCKYFDINKNEKSLLKFEKILNDFISVEQGKELLYKEKTSILQSILNSVPLIIKKYHEKQLSKKLGFETVDISDSYIPTFSFQYVSAGGYSSTNCDIKLSIENLNDLINYLNDEIKWKKSVAGQRALMTSQLRNQIKKRDNYKCCSCNIGTKNEPNLLLEIDHIQPVSKGGLTTIGNLQTLCWKCNRKKGAKVLVDL